MVVMMVRDTHVFLLEAVDGKDKSWGNNSGEKFRGFLLFRVRGMAAERKRREIERAGAWETRESCCGEECEWFWWSNWEGCQRHQKEGCARGTDTPGATNF